MKNSSRIDKKRFDKVDSIKAAPDSKDARVSPHFNSGVGSETSISAPSFSLK